MTVHIVPVPSQSVRSIWPLVEHHVEKALEFCQGTFLSIDLLEQCERGEKHLWVAQRDDGHVVAALIGFVNRYPRRTSYSVPFIGGTEVRTWFKKALLAIESWALENGCDALEGGARRGWLRMAKMQEAGVYLWKDLDAVSVESTAREVREAA